MAEKVLDSWDRWQVIDYGGVTGASLETVIGGERHPISGVHPALAKRLSFLLDEYKARQKQAKAPAERPEKGA